MAERAILAIDAGNTRIKWGVHDGERWAALGAVQTAEGEPLDAEWKAAPRAAGAVACNVAGAQVAARIEAACGRAGLALRWVSSQPLTLGVANGYRDFAQLGADRWVAMVAAHHAVAGHKLVVNAGTALTVDALAGDGRFLGGLIVPGPALMRRSLAQGTAGLRLTEGAFDAFPRSTPDAITSGAIQACAGAVARLAEAMAAHGAAPAVAVLSGGGAAEIAPHLSIAAAIHENLVLDGLALIARRT